jgi:CheY-like chemotaxis protein
LLVDDDAQDRTFLRDAFRESGMDAEFRELTSGEQLLEYLNRRGTFSAAEDAPAPSLILLDLNMPRKDGRQVLKDLKTDPELRAIPVVILTTSTADEDVKTSYESGANSFITKPMSFDGWIHLVESLGVYWFKTVSLPETQTV